MTFSFNVWFHLIQQVQVLLHFLHARLSGSTRTACTGSPSLPACQADMASHLPSKHFFLMYQPNSFFISQSNMAFSFSCQTCLFHLAIKHNFFIELSNMAYTFNCRSHIAFSFHRQKFTLQSNRASSFHSKTGLFHLFHSQTGLFHFSLTGLFFLS